MSKILRLVKARFLTMGGGSYNSEKEKKNPPVVVDWNWMAGVGGEYI